ncbi:hypothetical protein CDAR_584681 [Caerostris darwini]|uniref:Uncharacterized protein n=1 Tax=Caerostris darwini TaxID=1538125 RepID=A0AAV4Q492_9ARAC|nr:hypothetical protein CDAR_584681 [Caerostris darwini]
MVKPLTQKPAQDVNPLSKEGYFHFIVLLLWGHWADSLQYPSSNPVSTHVTASVPICRISAYATWATLPLLMAPWYWLSKSSISHVAKHS